MKKKRRLQEIIFGLVVIAIIVIVIVRSNSTKKSDADLRNTILSENYQLYNQREDTISYEEYFTLNAQAGKLVEDKEGEIEKTGIEYSEHTFAGSLTEDNGGIITEKDGSISYSFDVKKTGSYYVEVLYYPVADGTSTIQRSLYINGELPFSEATNIVFERLWQDESKSFLMVSNSNQSVPSQVQNPQWTKKRLESAEKTVMGPFVFFLEAGNNTLTFVSNGGTLGIASVKLIPTTGLVSYAEYKSNYEARGAKVIASSEISNEAVIVQAEDAFVKTASVLIPANDRTSPLTVPYHSSNILMNTIGGSTWEKAGQGITWEIEVPKSGFYKIATRYMQAENRDFYSNREIKINGNIPFEEASTVKFTYNSKFQVNYLGDGEEEYYFYLEEGKNTITLTVTMGDLSYAYVQTEISVKNFNNLYRRLTSVMGSEPDSYRDYNIVSSIPDMVDIMKTEYYRLTKVMESVGEDLSNNTKTNTIAKMLYQLEGLIKKPDSISKELKYFNNNLTAIGNWMHSLGSQPLKLDYLMICGEGYKLPKPDGNFIQNLTHNFKAFIGSFTNSYDTNIVEVAGNKKTVTVWIATATRDQYDIAQRIVNKAFENSSFLVDLKMVNADTVTPATLTGNGPDVALQLNYSMPANFAFRNAAYDLSKFSDYKEVASQFAKGAMEYFEFEGGYYALPDQMSFPVLYYRADILEELGLTVPNTWEELKEMLPYLQTENMKAYFVTTGYTSLGGHSTSATKPLNTVFLSKLYQHGQEIYMADGKSTNLETHDALMIFKEWTEFYTKLGFEKTMNVITRFRTGEVPIIIEDYTYMNVIRAAAPEIESSWSIAPIPGTIIDGNLERSTSCMISAAMMIAPSVEANDTIAESWEFLKWWVSEETQLAYAQELEALLGSAAEFPVANLNALTLLAEEKGIRAQMNEITRWLRGIPQKPGGYIIGRNVENAWISVVNDNVDPIDTLYNQINSINTEIKLKRKEFGLEN